MEASLGVENAAGLGKRLRGLGQSRRNSPAPSHPNVVVLQSHFLFANPQPHNTVTMENERGELVDLYATPRFLKKSRQMRLQGVRKRQTHKRQADTDHNRLTSLERAVTSPASAAQPTASSRPRTTALFRSLSPRSTRTADSPARLRPTPSAASFAPWASPTTASTASPSVTATSRTSGAPADKRFAPMV